jgi:hypothetical protein
MTTAPERARITLAGQCHPEEVSMPPTVDLSGKVNLPKALWLAHDEVRAAFSRVTQQEGPMAEAARRAARICLPHFKREEQAIFPVLELLPELACGSMRLEWVRLLPLISDFQARHDGRKIEDEWIRSATEELLQQAHRQKNKEIAELAHYITDHERTEHEIAYPAVTLIGSYLQERLAA